mmetsp:Transcript_15871/g.24906  ORF Transcript_15871/g.24906 Transcript_15871/m.24906 type:complete len:104 (-) Transcript_15871:1044-1355(-)
MTAIHESASQVTSSPYFNHLFDMAFPDVILSTTVLKLEHSGHCTPKKCQLQFSLFLSQSLHMIFTTLAKSSGMGCISISLALAVHAALMLALDTTVFLHIGHL